MASPTKLPDHDHCEFCGIALPKGEHYCSDVCRQGKADEERKEKMTEYGFLIIAILTVAIPAAFIFLK